MTAIGPIEIRDEPPSKIVEHATISNAFEVAAIFDVPFSSAGEAVVSLVERRIATPYVKEYDIPGNTPDDWARRFDMSNWGLISAWLDGRRAGGAVIAWKSDGVDMLEGRDDIAVLWDLRAAPQFRRGGVASALFAAVERWAVARGCRELKIETQNINVPACRFYASRGCELRAARRGAYPQYPAEIMLLWYKRLSDCN